MRLLTVGLLVLLAVPAAHAQVSEAPTGFDNATNGFTTQEEFEADRAVFEAQAEIAGGLGPMYNARACGNCHTNPVSGGSSQVGNVRAGRLLGDVFLPHPGGSLIHDRSIDAAFQERVLPNNNTRAFRISTLLLGAGFVEAIANDTLQAIAEAQPSSMRGQVVNVPVLEASNVPRVGRFGWKSQHASLVSFAADDYRNQIGITSPLSPTENTSNGHSVAAIDTVPDPEDAATREFPNGAAIAAVARFLRSTMAPPVDPELLTSPDGQAGSFVFNQIGCAVCHVRNIVTAPPGTIINGGAFQVPAALGSKIIHPFSDFLLHNVGTGDGIVQGGGQPTRLKVRTAVLWGLRTRARLMHDGLSLTRQEAILRHAGEATSVINAYRALTATQQNQLLVFLDSL